MDIRFMSACTYLISQQDQAILLTDTHNRLHLALAQHLACGIPRVDDAQSTRVYPTLPRRHNRRFHRIKVNAVPQTPRQMISDLLSLSAQTLTSQKEAAGLCIAYPQTPSSESVALYPSCVPPYEVIAALYSGYCGIGIRMPNRRAFRFSQQTAKSQQSSYRRSGLGSPSRARS